MSKIIGEPSTGNPESGRYYESPSAGAIVRSSRGRNETPFTCRAFTHVAPVAEIPTKLYFRGTHQLRNIVKITPERYKAVSVRQMWCRSKFSTAPSSFCPQRQRSRHTSKSTFSLFRPRNKCPRIVLAYSARRMPRDVTQPFQDWRNTEQLQWQVQKFTFSLMVEDFGVIKRNRWQFAWLSRR